MTEAIRWTAEDRLKALRELRWHLDAMAEEQGWDQPPQLFTVHSITQHGRPGVAAAPLPGWHDVARRAVSMQHALAGIQEVYRGLGPSRRAEALPRDPVLGVILVHEVWMLRDRNALAAGHPPTTSPLRVEARCTHLSTATTDAVLAHERGGIVDELSKPGLLSGAVPDLLRTLGQVLTT